MIVDNYLLLVNTLLVFYLIKYLFQLRNLAYILNKMGLEKQIPNTIILMIVVGLIGPNIGWSTLEGLSHIRPPILIISAMLAWKICTQDIDLFQGSPLWAERILIACLPIGVYVYPLFLLPFFYLAFHLFDAWSKHTRFPYQLLMFFVAVLISSRGMTLLSEQLSISNRMSISPFVIISFSLQGASFFIAAVSKIKLGPHWYSWALENRTSDLAASSYHWGWLKCMKPEIHSKFLHILIKLNCPLQFSVFFFELAALFVLSAPSFAFTIGIIAITFHVGIFVVTGILFWEWIVTHSALLWLLTLLPQHIIQHSFGLEGTLCTFVLILLFSTKEKLWEPLFLGWWDTPFSQIIDWRVRGESGRIYSFYYNYLCPHEHSFVSDRRGAVWTGELWCTSPFSITGQRSVRDALRASKGQEYEIEKAKKIYHNNERNLVESQKDLDDMILFCLALNSGAQKQVFPTFLWWLKAPKGFYFNWGKYPKYDRSDPIVELLIGYREEFFTGEKHIVLQDRVVKCIRLDSLPANRIEAERKKAL